MLDSFALLAIIVGVSCEVCIVLAPYLLNTAENDLFPLSIIHINDFHARFDETNEEAATCKDDEKCIGGYARAVTVIKELQSVRANPIYLNAGDNFQGTFWFTIGGWNVTSQFLNMLDADVVTLGNHEFDRGIEGVVPFMESVKSPIVVANIDDSDEPSFQGKYQKSIIIDRYDRKIGVIGAIISSVNEIANTGNLRFYDESEAIRNEAIKLKEQGVDIIIALTHCGLGVDYRIAKETAPFVDVIVGGHSHTFMYTVKEGESAPGPDKVKDVYPAVVETEDGHRVLIVQASARMKYVGDLVVFFDKEGKVVKWQGAPIYLDHEIKQDPDVLAAIQPWKEIVDSQGKQTIGHNKLLLNKKICEWEECIFGNFVADAFVHHYITSFSEQEAKWKDPIIALLNAGSLRANISPGPITYSDLATTMPFENEIDVFELRGDHLTEVFEHAAEGVWLPEKSYWKQKPKFFIQTSGARVAYNMSKATPNRVSSIEIITIKDNIPRYEPLDPTKYYHCITTSYLTEGGDTFHMIPKHMRNLRKGSTDIDAVIQYLKYHNVIYPALENRIKFMQ